MCAIIEDTLKNFSFRSYKLEVAARLRRKVKKLCNFKFFSWKSFWKIVFNKPLLISLCWSEALPEFWVIVAIPSDCVSHLRHQIYKVTEVNDILIRLPFRDAEDH